MPRLPRALTPPREFTGGQNIRANVAWTALERPRARRAGGEDQPAHPHAITPKGPRSRACVAIPSLNTRPGRSLGELCPSIPCFLPHADAAVKIGVLCVEG